MFIITSLIIAPDFYVKRSFNILTFTIHHLLSRLITCLPATETFIEPPYNKTREQILDNKRFLKLKKKIATKVIGSYYNYNNFVQKLITVYSR